jgi:hypothetical protein
MRRSRLSRRERLPDDASRAAHLGSLRSTTPPAATDQLLSESFRHGGPGRLSPSGPRSVGLPPLSSGKYQCPPVLSFLKHLARHIPCPISLLWDRFMPQRARLVQNHISKKRGWSSHFLPPYAPELNPTENVLRYLKTNAMAVLSRSMNSSSVHSSNTRLFFALNIGHLSCRNQ